MIDLTNAQRALDEANTLMSFLDGVELNESDALTSQSRGEARKIKAQHSQNLQLLANRLELAAALVRTEYWFARGEADPCRPDRTN